MRLKPGDPIVKNDLTLAPEQGCVFYKGERISLTEPIKFKVLESIHTQHPNFVPNEELRRSVWKTSYVDENIPQQHVSQLNKILQNFGFYIYGARDFGYALRLIKDGPPRLMKHLAEKSKRNISFISTELQVSQKSPYEIDGLERERQILSFLGTNDNDRPPKKDRSSNDGLPLFIEGGILNPAAELIYGLVDTKTGLTCRRLYKASLEDLAFALVSSSKISTFWLPTDEVIRELGLPREGIKTEPTAHLIATLRNDLYQQISVDPGLRYGRILQNEAARSRIAQYLRTFANCFANATIHETCKEWMKREAERYLGDDRKLCDPRADLGTLVFGKIYYQSDFVFEVPKIIGKAVLDTLTSFLPVSPSAERSPKAVRRYTAKAKEHFVSTYLLTHFTVMREYEQMTESSGARTLLSTIRSTVKRQWHKTHREPEKNALKRIAIRSALFEALKQTEDENDRESILDCLVLIREWPEYCLLRERLQELNKLEREDGEKARKGERRLLDELSYGRAGSSTKIDHVGLDSQTVMGPSSFGNIGRVDPREYLRLFFERFPELASPENR